MQFRASKESKTVEVSLDEFKELVSRGEIHPKALVCDKILTDSNWRTVDNLRIFHRNSPVQYPYGEHLIARLENQERKREQVKRTGRLYFQYIEGTLIEERYQLISLSRIAKTPDVLGVSRFFVLESFKPEQIFTFTFKSNVLKIEKAEGKTQLWDSLPHLTSKTAPDGLWQEIHGEPFAPEQILRASTALDIHHLSSPFNSWQAFLTEAKKATSCEKSGLALDGISYRHKVHDMNTVIDISWGNPSKDEHFVQMALIQAYDDCIKTAGLSSRIARL